MQTPTQFRCFHSAGLTESDGISFICLLSPSPPVPPPPLAQLLPELGLVILLAGKNHTLHIAHLGDLTSAARAGDMCAVPATEVAEMDDVFMFAGGTVEGRSFL